MWRFGYPNPVNYNDNELFCGGYAVQWDQNDGKCGVCGDAYHAQRSHEAGGEYAKGIIGRRYAAGQVTNYLIGSTTLTISCLLTTRKHRKSKSKSN